MPTPDEVTTGADWPPSSFDRRLAFLLKHARLRLAELTAPALAPFGIDGRQLALLSVLEEEDSLSQQRAATRLATDRTTMVALLDSLEAKGLVERRPHRDDRRKNIVALTPAGRETLEGAALAVDEAERQFLAPLDRRDAERLAEVLRLLIAPDATSG